MKKFLIVFLISFLLFPFSFANAKVIKGEVEFDWITKSQIERDESIKNVKNIIFNDNTIVKYNKKEFKNEYSDKLKNKNYLRDYQDIVNGKKEDSEKIYCGFFWKNILIAYGIRYKNNTKENFYYDSMGTLRMVDKYSSNYPKYPYYSYQYDRNGKMRAAYYFVSQDNQYVYDEKGNFKGIWHKDVMYNRLAKPVMTRTNWE